jgi:hypothetical protein
LPPVQIKHSSRLFSRVTVAVWSGLFEMRHNLLLARGVILLIFLALHTGRAGPVMIC